MMAHSSLAAFPPGQGGFATAASGGYKVLQRTDADQALTIFK